MRRSRATSPALRVAEVAVGRALHDRLGAGEPEVRAVAFGHREVRAADEEATELRLAQLLVELRVAASRDVDLESIGRLLHDLVIEGAARGELCEPRSKVSPRLALFCDCHHFSPSCRHVSPSVLRTIAFA